MKVTANVIVILRLTVRDRFLSLKNAQRRGRGRSGHEKLNKFGKVDLTARQARRRFLRQTQQGTMFPTKIGARIRKASVTPL